MKTRLPIFVPILAFTLVLALVASVSAQVATLSTPAPDPSASAAAAEPADDEDAILEFVACLRDNGLEISDSTVRARGHPFR